MKKLYYVLLGVSLTVASSCKKGELAADNGCISRIQRHYLSGADSLAAVALLKINHIDNSNLTYTGVTLNDTIANAGAVGVYQHVFALQYFNGLPLFFSNIGLHFRKEVYYLTSGHRYNSINLSTHPILSLPVLRKLFLDQAARANSIRTATYKDSCLVAEFGYLNIGTNDAPRFVKAWEVTPKNVEYPQAFFRDDDGSTISYFDGIMTL